VSLVSTVKYVNRKSRESTEQLECFGEGLVKSSWCKPLAKVSASEIAGTGTPLHPGADEWNEAPAEWAKAWRNCFDGNEVVLMEVWKR